MGEPENLFKVGKLYIHKYQKSKMKNNHLFFLVCGCPKSYGGGAERYQLEGSFFSAQPFEGQDRDGEAVACPQMRSPLLPQHFLQSGQRSAQGRQGFYF